MNLSHYFLLSEVLWRSITNMLRWGQTIITQQGTPGQKCKVNQLTESSILCWTQNKCVWFSSENGGKESQLCAAHWTGQIFPKPDLAVPDLAANNFILQSFPSRSLGSVAIIVLVAFGLYNSYFFIYFLHFTVYTVRTLQRHIFSLGTYPRHMLILSC